MANAILNFHFDFLTPSLTERMNIFNSKNGNFAGKPFDVLTGKVIFCEGHYQCLGGLVVHH